jgi:hypothetical protein
MSKARVSRVTSHSRRRARRARQPILLAGGAALAIALGSAVSIASFSGVDIAAAAVTKAQSLADLMRQRSPGARTEAQLTKHKKPFSRVLAERELPDIPVLQNYRPVVELLAPPLQPPVELIPSAVPLLAAAVPPSALFFKPPVGGVFAPPPGGGGGGGGGGGPGGPPQQPPPPPGTPEQPPAVPEPGTWAMMIAGFGLTGWTFRRRRGAIRRPVDG